jgi:hypothetical protein
VAVAERLLWLGNSMAKMAGVGCSDDWGIVRLRWLGHSVIKIAVEGCG